MSFCVATSSVYYFNTALAGARSSTTLCPLHWFTPSTDLPYSTHPNVRLVSEFAGLFTNAPYVFLSFYQVVCISSACESTKIYTNRHANAIRARPLRACATRNQLTHTQTNTPTSTQDSSAVVALTWRWQAGRQATKLSKCCCLY